MTKHKNALFTCVTSALGLLFISTHSLADSAGKNQAPQPLVSNNIIVSQNAPALAVQVAKQLQYLGRHTITIRDVAGGERLVFADTQGNNINRLFIAQFEAFHDNTDHTYNYNMDNKPIVAGYPWRSNAYAFDMEQARVQNPTGESADTAAFLESKGLIVPQNWLMWRSLTVTDPARKSELILFYIEFGKDHNMTLADIYQGDDATDLWQTFQKELQVRANNSFNLAAPINGQIPPAANWQPIPITGLY